MSFEAGAPSISSRMTMLAIYPPQWVLDYARQHAQEGVLKNGLHVTLVRLGQTDESEARMLQHLLEQSAKLLEPITLSIEGSGFFNARDFLVHWLLINGANLDIWRSTFLQITDKMGHLPEQRYGYTPHMTLGYYGKSEGGLPEGWENSGIPSSNKKWLCDEIYLVRGTGQKIAIPIGPPAPSKFQW